MIDVSHAKTESDWAEINRLTDIETKRRICLVKGSEHYGIRTAAIIDGEFILVSDYDLPEEFFNALENAN